MAPVHLKPSVNGDRNGRYIRRRDSVEIASQGGDHFIKVEFVLPENVPDEEK